MYPAVALGGLGILAGFRLVRSIDPAADMVEATATDLADRMAAAVLAAIVPFVAGLVAFVVVVVGERDAGPWTYGTLGSGGRAVVLASQVAIPALGGPLLGVALARWTRAVWAAPAVFAGLIVWCLVVNGLGATYPHSGLARAVRLLSPFSYFVSLDARPPRVETWTGSPGWFLVWQLSLCGLAGAAAVSGRRQARSSQRRWVFALVLSAVATTYFLAVLAGEADPVVTYPGGWTVGL